MLKRASDRLGGTRKGLFFGTVQVVEKLDGHFTIRDAHIPNLLPMAFSILQGIDDNRDKHSYSENLVIIVEKRTAEKCANVLDLNLKGSKNFWVDSKHFTGNSYIFNLKSRDL